MLYEVITNRVDSVRRLFRVTPGASRASASYERPVSRKPVSPGRLDPSLTFLSTGFPSHDYEHKTYWGAGQGRNTARSCRGFSFDIVRSEIIGYRIGELFEVTTVLFFGIVHAERDVFRVGTDACHLPMPLTRIAPDRRPAHGFPMPGYHRDIHNRRRAEGRKVGCNTHLGLHVGNFKASRKDRTHPIGFLNRFDGLPIQSVPSELSYQSVFRPQFQKAYLRLGVLDKAHEFLGGDLIEILLGVGGNRITSYNVCYTKLLRNLR